MGATLREVKYDGNSVRVCQCDEGYFIGEKDDLFCGSVITCIKCSDGMICKHIPTEGHEEGASPINETAYRNQELQSVKIEKGMYRLSDNSTTVVSCPIARACIGGASSSDSLCAEGHSGVLCQVCWVADDVIYVWSDGKCEICDHSHKGFMYGLLVLFVLCLCGVAIYIVKHREKAKNVYLKTKHMWERFSRTVLTKYKIGIDFSVMTSHY
jgi:hypothetical protein